MKQDEKGTFDRWREAEAQVMEGWEFSHLKGRMRGEPLPWDYTALLLRHLRPDHRLLDMGTGGGEFLLTLGHPYHNTSVTENWPPNFALCRRRLAPLGIAVRQAPNDLLPYGDAQFDIVANRHESYDMKEVCRVLRPGGLFLTQQVGGENNRALSERLIRGFVPPYPNHNLQAALAEAEAAGLTVLDRGEAHPVLSFADIPALIAFAKAIPWEFPDFSVEACLAPLRQLQQELEREGEVRSTEHRFYLLCRRDG